MSVFCYKKMIIHHIPISRWIENLFDISHNYFLCVESSRLDPEKKILEQETRNINFLDPEKKILEQ